MGLGFWFEGLGRICVSVVIWVLVNWYFRCLGWVFYRFGFFWMFDLWGWYNTVLCGSEGVLGGFGVVVSGACAWVGLVVGWVVGWVVLIDWILGGFLCWWFWCVCGFAV